MAVGLADATGNGSHCKNDTDGSSAVAAERVLIVEDDSAARIGLEQLIKSRALPLPVQHRWRRPRSPPHAYLRPVKPTAKTAK